MIAINLMNKREYEVKQYNDILYFETDNESLPYYILERSYDIESEIAYGMRYTYYKIDNKLYSGYLSNVYKSFAKPVSQMSLDI